MAFTAPATARTIQFSLLLTLQIQIPTPQGYPNKYQHSFGNPPLAHYHHSGGRKIHSYLYVSLWLLKFAETSTANLVPLSALSRDTHSSIRAQSPPSLTLMSAGMAPIAPWASCATASLPSLEKSLALEKKLRPTRKSKKRP